MKLKLAFILLGLANISVYASGSEGWTSDDESGVPLREASGAAAEPDFSGLYDEEFPGESIESHYVRNDKEEVIEFVISCTAEQLALERPAKGAVLFRTLKINTESKFNNI